MNDILARLRRLPGTLLTALTAGQGILSRRTVTIFIVLATVVVLVGLPVFAQTKAYPIAVVDGNSMVPTLHNGDLIFYAAPKTPTRNGSIIVFVQSDTAISPIDALLKPIIIHRIISIGQEPNGAISYQTKGDNNQVADPFVTDRQNVLGTPVLIVPFVGFPILFFKTSYGMLTVVALVSLYFFSGVDTRMAEEEARKRLVALFARHSLSGEISRSQFEKLNVAVEYGDAMPSEEVRDPMTLSVINWLRAGGLENDWKEELVECPSCKSPSFRVVSGEADILVCPSCEGAVTEKTETDSSVQEPVETEQQSLPMPEEYTEPVTDPVEERTVYQTESHTEISLEDSASDFRDEIARLLLERLPIGQVQDEKTEREEGKSKTRRKTNSKPEPDY